MTLDDKIRIKQLASLSAVYSKQPEIPKLFKSLNLFPIQDDWHLWADGHGNELKISQKNKNSPQYKKIYQSKNEIYFLADPYFCAPFNKIYPKLKKTFWILTNKKYLLLFSLDFNNIFRTTIFTTNQTFHYSPLIFQFHKMLEIFSFLEQDAVAPADWTFFSRFGKMKKNSKDGIEECIFFPHAQETIKHA